jgi:hypothetical protein
MERAGSKDVGQGCGLPNPGQRFADATTLQQRFAELREAEVEVDRLYRRWSELEEKS